MTTPNERDRFEAWAKDTMSLVKEPGGYKEATTHHAWRAWQAALTREQREGVCPKCNGAGGERWHEADGSENGQRCDVCDGFGTQQEAPGAVAQKNPFFMQIEAFNSWHDETYPAPNDAEQRGLWEGRKSQRYATWNAAIAWFKSTPPAPVDVRVDAPKPDWLYWYQRTVWWTAKAKEFGYDPDNGIFHPGNATIRADVRLQQLADKWERLVAHNTTDEGEAFRHCASDLRALLDGQQAGVDHVASRDCWCEPTQDTEEPSVYIHRSKDDGH